MGKLLLIVLAVIVAFMVISLVISALHFLFFVALVVLIVLGALRLTSGMAAALAPVTCAGAGVRRCAGRQHQVVPGHREPGSSSRDQGNTPVPRCPGPEV